MRCIVHQLQKTYKSPKQHYLRNRVFLKHAVSTTGNPSAGTCELKAERPEVCPKGGFRDLTGRPGARLGQVLFKSETDFARARLVDQQSSKNTTASLQTTTEFNDKEMASELAAQKVFCFVDSQAGKISD